MNTDVKTPALIVPAVENKDASKPKFKGIGYWNAYMRSVEYQSLKPGESRISEDELAQHCSSQNMWMALRDKSTRCVYDVTKFAEYHPGGSELIAEHAGMDASEAFQKVHAYVSLEMISRLKKGILVQSTHRRPLPNFLSPSMSSILARPKSRKKPRWDWDYDPSKSCMILTVLLGERIISPVPDTHCLAFCRQVSNGSDVSDTSYCLTLRVLCESQYYYLKIRLIDDLRADLSSLVLSSEDISTTISYPIYQPIFSIDDPCLKINLHSINQSHLSTVKHQQSTLGSVIQDNFVALDHISPMEEIEFFPCCIVTSSRLLSSKYLHLQLLWPSLEANIPVPLLHHVMIQITDSNGVKYFRPYTPVDFKFIQNQSAIKAEKCYFNLLIKVYNNGCVSRLLANLQVDDLLSVSLPMGSLHPSLLVNQSQGLRFWNSIFMFAGGSGITPFLRIIDLCLSKTAEYSSELPQSTLSSPHLLWFNRTLADLVFVEELEKLKKSSNSRFTINHILSDESDTNLPNGYIKGSLTDDICRRLLSCSTDDPSSSEDTLWLICGPPGFNDAAVKLLNSWKVPRSTVHVLQG